MRVRLLKPWGTYRAGECFNPQPNMAGILIKRGLALEIPDKPTQAHTTQRPNRKAKKAEPA